MNNQPKTNPPKGEVVVNNGRIIEAKLIRETPKSWLLDCEGDVEWFSKQHCNFDADKSQLEAPLWMLKQKFPDTKF